MFGGGSVATLMAVLVAVLGFVAVEVLMTVTVAMISIMLVMVGMGVMNIRWYVGMGVLNASWNVVDILLPGLSSL